MNEQQNNEQVKVTTQKRKRWPSVYLLGLLFESCHSSPTIHSFSAVNTLTPQPTPYTTGNFYQKPCSLLFHFIVRLSPLQQPPRLSPLQQPPRLYNSPSVGRSRSSPSSR